MGILQEISPIALVTLSILLFEHCTTVTLTRYTQQRTDAPRAIPVIVVFLTECLKLVLAATLELTTCYGLGSGKRVSHLRAAVFDAPQDTSRVSLPAGLYTCQNILIFVALGNLEIVSFQVLYQTKLMLTAILSVVFLARQLTRRQWLSLLTLTAGVIAVELSDAELGKKPAASSPSAGRGRQLALREYGVRDAITVSAHTAACTAPRRPTLALSDEPLTGVWRGDGTLPTACQAMSGANAAPLTDAAISVSSDEELLAVAAVDGARRLASGKHHHHGAHADAPPGSTPSGDSGRVPLLGVLAALAAATLSSFAGVYFEALVKSKEVASPSLWVRNVQLCIFTIPLAALAVAGKWQAVVEHGFTTGLDTPTIILITLNASGGLLVAACIKYGDNILKNFTTSCSVILGTLISVVLFDFKLSMQFLWGSALVVGSAYVYATAPAAEQPKHEPDEDSPAPAKEEETPLHTGESQYDSGDS